MEGWPAVAEHRHCSWCEKAVGNFYINCTQCHEPLCGDCVETWNNAGWCYECLYVILRLGLTPSEPTPPMTPTMSERTPTQENEEEESPSCSPTPGEENEEEQSPQLRLRLQPQQLRLRLRLQPHPQLRPPFSF
jgi:hypothetical protein